MPEIFPHTLIYNFWYLRYSKVCLHFFLFPTVWFPVAESWMFSLCLLFSIFVTLFSLIFTQCLNKGDKQKCKTYWKVSWGTAIAAFRFVLGTVRCPHIRPRTSSLIDGVLTPRRYVNSHCPIPSWTRQSTQWCCYAHLSEAMANHRRSLIIWGHA